MSTKSGYTPKSNKEMIGLEDGEDEIEEIVPDIAIGGH